MSGSGGWNQSMNAKDNLGYWDKEKQWLQQLLCVN